MTNYPALYMSSAPWNEEEREEELVKCYVTDDLFREDEMIQDRNTSPVRWFHKSKVEQYVDLCALEFNWNQEEVQDALKEFNQ